MISSEFKLVRKKKRRLPVYPWHRHLFTSQDVVVETGKNLHNSPLLALHLSVPAVESNAHVYTKGNSRPLAEPQRSAASRACVWHKLLSLSIAMTTRNEQLAGPE